MRSRLLLALVCAGLLAVGTEIRPKNTVVSEPAIRQWFSEQKIGISDRDLLVQARTIWRDEECKEIETCMEIEHVFYGPEFLKGKQFLVVSPKEPPRSSFVVYPAPDLNDVGIWRLHVSKNSVDAGNDLIALIFGLPLPVFEKDGDEYKIAIPHCKAVEEVSKLPGREKQVSRLKQLSLSQTPETSRWATTVLAREKPDGIVDFLRGLIANEKSTVAAQVVADKALIELDRKAWQHSNERVEMVENWVHAKSSLEGIGGGLYRIAKHHDFGLGFDKKKFLSFLSIAALNDNISILERREIIANIIRDFPKQFKDDSEFQDEVFQALASVMVKSKDKDVKLEAAHALVKAFSLESKTRQRILRELMESKDSGEGGRFLREHFDIDSVD